MKMNERLRRNMTVERKLTDFNLRLPETVVSDLQEVATAFGYSSSQAVVRAYISDGLREHLRQLDEQTSRDHTLVEFGARLAARGVPEDAIAQVQAEMQAAS